MSAIFLPRRWRHQPQGAVEVDWRHPLADGLSVFMLGDKRFATENPGYTSSGTIARVFTPEGEAASFSDRAHINASNWASSVGQHGGTVISSQAILNGDGSSAYVIGLRENLGGTGRLEIARNTSSGLIFFGFNSTAIAHTTSNFWALGEKRTTAVSWMLGGARFFVDGVMLHSTGASLTAKPGAFYVNTTAASDSLGKWARPSELYFVGVWSRPLLDEEQREMSDAPYQIFRAPARRIIFDLGDVSPALEIKPDSLIVVSSVASSALSLEHHLALDDIAAKVAIQTGAINTSLMSSPENMSALVSLAESALTLDSVVAPDNLDVDAAIGPTALTTAAYLAVDSIPVQIIVQDATLSTKKEVVVDDLLVAAGIQAATIQTQLNLFPDNLGAVVQVESGALLTGAIIAPDPLLVAAMLSQGGLSASLTVMPESVTSLVNIGDGSISTKVIVSAHDIELEVKLDASSLYTTYVLNPDGIYSKVVVSDSALDADEFVTIHPDDINTLVFLSDGILYLPTPLPGNLVDLRSLYLRLENKEPIIRIENKAVTIRLGRLDPMSTLKK